MKILYDHQIFQQQNYGGISRYHVELYLGLKQFQFILPDISIEYSDNIYLKKTGFCVKKQYDPYDSFIRKNEFPSKRRLFDLKNKIFYTPSSDEINKQNTIVKLKEGNFDVFHPTSYDPYFLKYLSGKPYVITVHDLTQEIYPEFFPNDYTYKLKELIIKHASHIIAVSNTTKQDLIDFYNYPSHKISVIYHWYSLPELNTTLPLYLPEKYLLYIGERGGYKNFLFLARALKNIFEKHVDLRLLCTGREFSNEEKIFFSTLGIAENIIHIFSEDSDLPYIYRHASALIFPSLYEGFGIPLLEATQNNCPLILSNITVFQEITKGKARFFYPKSANSIIQTISDHLDAQIRVLPFDMNIFNSAISIQKHIEVYNDLI